jgi:hypothetical protein
MTVNVRVSGATTNTVSIERKQNGYLALTVRGPQGPAFAGQQFFDTSAMESLTVADSGVTVKWNGTQFAPASELSEGITINGGAF